MKYYPSIRYLKSRLKKYKGAYVCGSPEHRRELKRIIDEYKRNKDYKSLRHFSKNAWTKTFKRRTKYP